MRNIGFTHGATWKICNPYTKENINLFKHCDCSAIEINCHASNDTDKFDDIEALIKDFNYRSIHLPCDLEYKNDELTNDFLKKIDNFYHDIKASLTVVHPDKVLDWSVFDYYPDLNWAIENLDDKAMGYKDVETLKKFFAAHPQWNFVLDLGHCNANDKTMKLAEDFIFVLKDKIKEIHLSGYEVFHDPLNRTKQVEIIQCCKRLEVPIIVESVIEPSDGLGGVKREFDYIIQNLISNEGK